MEKTQMTITTTMIKELRTATGAGPLDCRQALQTYHGNFEQAASYLRQQDLTRAAQKTGRATNEGLVIVKNTDNGIGAIEITCETDFVARTDEFKTLAHRLVAQVLADVTLTDANKLLAADFIDTPGKKTADVIKELIGKLGENIVLRHVARYTSDNTNIVEGYIHAGAIEGYGPMEGRVGVLVELEANEAAAHTDDLRDLAHNLALQIAALNPGYISPDDIPDDIMQNERQTLTNQLAAVNKPDSIKTKIVEGRLNDFYQKVCLLKQPFIKDKNLNIEELIQKKSEAFGTIITIKQFARFEVGV
jgi:elongation factor Ts